MICLHPGSTHGARCFSPCEAWTQVGSLHRRYLPFRECEPPPIGLCIDVSGEFLKTGILAIDTSRSSVRLGQSVLSTGLD